MKPSVPAVPNFVTQRAVILLNIAALFPYPFRKRIYFAYAKSVNLATAKIGIVARSIAAYLTEFCERYLVPFDGESLWGGGTSSEPERDKNSNEFHDLILFKKMRNNSINSSKRFESQRMNPFEHAKLKLSIDHLRHKVTLVGT